MFNWLISPSETFAAIAELWSDMGLALFTVIALAFVAAEYAAEHLHWPWGEAKKAAFAVLVIVGFTGELFFEMGSFRYSYALQGDQADTIKNLVVEAGDAKSDAEAAERVVIQTKTTLATLEMSEVDLRREITKNERYLLGRRITKSEYTAIQSLKGKVPTVRILLESNCAECLGFSAQMADAFASAGITAQMMPYPLLGGGGGCVYTQPPDSEIVFEALHAGGFSFHKCNRLPPNVPEVIPVISVVEAPGLIPSVKALPWQPGGTWTGWDGADQ